MIRSVLAAVGAVALTLAPAPSMPLPPDPPQAVVATAGDASAIVAWEPSKDPGGIPIHHYDVTADPGPATCQTPDGTTATCTVTGLSNGTTYTFTVTATNEEKLTSDPSEPSNPVIPDIPPEPPDLDDVYAGDGFLVPMWYPGYSAGTPFTGFTATAQPGDHKCTFAPQPGDLYPYSCTIDGLVNLTTYTVTVVEHNTGMTSAPSNAIQAVPRIHLQAPRNVTGVAGENEATVSWDPPPDTGLPVLRYEVRAEGRELSTTSTSVRIQGLMAGRDYTFGVRAFNALEWSPERSSEAVTPTPGPSGPDGGPTLVGWGRNTGGELGDGSLSPAASPVRAYLVGALGGKDLIAVASGYAHSCAVDADGKVYCWGTGLFTDNSWLSTVAIPQAGLPEPATSVALGEDFTCALTRAGHVFCWGRGSNGVLGNGGWASSTSPVQVSTAGVLSGKRLVALSAGLWHVCALDDGGSAYCWGRGYSGELGNGERTVSDVPVAVQASGVRFTSIAAGTFHTCATDDAGNAYCWGEGGNGQLGDGTGNPALVPIMVGPIAGRGITAGAAHSCAVDKGGQVRCWGWNGVGQLGDGTTDSSLTPVTVSAGDCTAVAAESSSTCALHADGVALCWGEGRSGELGSGTSTMSTTPVAVDTSGVPAGTAVVALSPGANSMLALAAAGPDAPGAVAATAGDARAVVSWTPPADHGAAIDTYRVVATPGGATCDATGTSCVLTGLTNGTTYTFAVRAHNVVGWGPAASSGPVTPTAVLVAPGKVTGLKARVLRKKISIRWKRTGGATSYQYRIRKPHKKFGPWHATTATRVVIRHHKPGKYRFQVRAVNEAGVGPKSTLVIRR